MSPTKPIVEEFLFTVSNKDKGQRLDLFLSNAKELSLSRNQIQKLIDRDEVLVNGQLPQKRYKLTGGDVITLSLAHPEVPVVTPENIPIDIRFEDEHLAVINKPAGMVVHPAVGNRSGTLVNALLHHFRNLSQSGTMERAGIVHRLDKNTSGLLLVAKSDVTHSKLQEALQKREIKRNYSALVCGHVKERNGGIHSPIGRSTRDRKKMAVTKRSSREAHTIYKLIERFRSYDLLDITLQTGRTHQIRVHFSHLGHPVFGDSEYGGRDKWHRGIFAPERKLGRKLLDLMPRQALHARRLEFVHPIKGASVIIESDLPNDFSQIIEILNREGS